MFHFRLQSLLNFRKLEEDRLQKELAGIYSLRESAEAALARLQASRVKTFTQFQQQQRRGLNGRVLQQYDRYLVRVDDDIRNRRYELEGIEKQYAEKLMELLEAVKKRKMLDKLKTRQAHREGDRLRLAEQNFLDEVATSTFNRKRRING